MGTYILSADEIEEAFEDFLQSQEGEIHAEVIVKLWNKFSKKYDWNEKIKLVKEEK